MFTLKLKENRENCDNLDTYVFKEDDKPPFTLLYSSSWV